ncbi:MAG: phosphoribosylamine--glycine ligase [Nitrospirae bacterium]|nr:phosphoribosylamine--glycine ligase [Candidatus Troglogloeales bacterium]
MRILVIGGGGREAALVFKIAQSKKVTKLFCAPGNAGIASYATCVPIAVNQIEQLLQFAKENQIDLTVVGPEIPLSLGVVDLFQSEGLKIFGPRKRAAQLESSKAFSKQFMRKYHILTPEAEVVTLEEAAGRIEKLKMPIVLKVDGLAAGKGVVIAQDIQEAMAGLGFFKSIGKGTEKILLEQYLIGVEATFLVVADSETVVPLASAKDYKRLFDNDLGPNTGGMGAVSPAPTMTPELHAHVMTKIMQPTLKGLTEEGIAYQGILYVGLMLTEEGPYVLEFNARLGDPEAQAVLPRLKTDWVDLMEAVLEHRLDRLKLEWDDAVSVCVVLASDGYPGDFKKGEEIFGLGNVEETVMVFHAGTAQNQGASVTAGGRVLGVTALGSDYQSARAKCYQAIDRISFEGMLYRKDIGR